MTLPTQERALLKTADPTADVVQSMNKLMFRAAVEATSWFNITQLIDPGLSVNSEYSSEPDRYTQRVPLRFPLVRRSNCSGDLCGYARIPTLLGLVDAGTASQHVTL
jgi:hypothetical protein